MKRNICESLNFFLNQNSRLRKKYNDINLSSILCINFINHDDSCVNNVASFKSFFRKIIFETIFPLSTADSIVHIFIVVLVCEPPIYKLSNSVFCSGLCFLLYYLVLLNFWVILLYYLVLLNFWVILLYYLFLLYILFF